jgi:protocatechuate 3,4-dioxygenase beta subunit
MTSIRIFAIAGLFLSLISANANATVKIATAKISNELFQPKKPTPTRLFSADLSMPEKFNTTNNLVQKTGSFYAAFGEIIYVQGNITDSFNVPISGAIVEIWQTNSAGKYQTLLDENSDLVDKNFGMSGRTTTDNLGNYYFITVMPGFYLNRSPHINFNIYHSKFGKIETEMYFQDHPRNNLDYQYLSYTKEERDLLTAKVRLIDVFNSKSTKIAVFDIVMKGIHQYKGFGK